MEIIEQIEKAKKADQNAYTFLLNSFWSEVYSFMLKRCENETLAEDITIETFSKAFDKIHSYNSEFQFNTWLIAIAKNIHTDILRKNKRVFFVEISDVENDSAYNIDDTSATIEDKLIIEQNLSLLLECLKELKPHYQEIIQLRYFQEMSYLEIAEKLNIPMSNVKVKLLRAKGLLAGIIRNKKRK